MLGLFILQAARLRALFQALDQGTMVSKHNRACVDRGLTRVCRAGLYT
jgi:ribosome assembly protein YihI (activator of Der GTPase)